MSTEPRTEMTRAALETAVRELAHQTFVVEHNSGTFSAVECHRAVGTGEPRYGEYEIHERVCDGRRTLTGCDPKRAPGYARYSRTEIDAARKQLADLRLQIRAAR